MFEYTNGKTISAVAKDGIFPVLSHITARIINEATGVALIMLISGERNSENPFINDDIAPVSMPAAVPTRKPAVILITENKIDNQNS